MARKPVIFLGKKYKTQGEFQNYVKKIIYEDIGKCDDVKNTYPLEYNILVKILERHPNFTSKSENMCNIKIVCDELNINALKTIIVKEDGDEIDISWRCAISGKSKTPKYELISAMRSSIEEQIFQFKIENKTKMFCVLCNSCKDLQIDHNDEVGSAFDELVFNFIKENNKIPTKFGDTNDNTHRRCFLEIDKEFENKWCNYHRQNSKLRVLCKNCNISRPKTKNKYIHKS